MEIRKQKKEFKVAPLPFQGQKRNFVAPFREALTDLKGKVTVIVDLFGGSGLLSHTAKQVFPECKVIYNDYDDFHLRLLNIDNTNNLLSDIRAILSGYPKEKRINEPLRGLIFERIEREARTDYVDYITLSSSLLFSANYVTSFEELKTATLFNKIKKCNYDIDATLYLAGLDIVKCDYLELFNQYKDVSDVLFIVDPPYLTTDCKTYQSDKYWKLKDYLNVLNVLTKDKYIYFTSNKSNLVELCEWFTDNYNLDNPFTGATLKTHNVSLNKQARYVDMMFYKFAA